MRGWVGSAVSGGGLLPCDIRAVGWQSARERGPRELVGLEEETELEEELTEGELRA